MSEFVFRGPLAGESTAGRILRQSAARTAAVTAASGGTFESQAIRSDQPVVFVDVGSRKVDANVSRNGVPIGVLQIDPDVLGGVIIDRPIFNVKVVSQSIPPGTPVPVGTDVDLVMAPPSQLNVGIVAGTHVAIRDQNMSQAFQTFVAGKPQVDRIIARAASGSLSNEDEAAIRDLFTSNGIEILDSPGHDVSAALESLRVMSAFGR